MAKTRDDEIYESGVRDGQSANELDRILHALGNHIPVPSTRGDEIYEKGYQYGLENPSSSDGGSSSDSSGSDSSSSSGGGCYLSSACVVAMGLPDSCPELTLLRQFRDEHLMRHPHGAALVARYYETAPGLVKAAQKRDDAENLFRELYQDLVAPCVKLIRSGLHEAAVARYIVATQRFASALRR